MQVVLVPNLGANFPGLRHVCICWRGASANMTSENGKTMTMGFSGYEGL